MKPSDYIRKGWTTGELARDAKGVPVLPSDDEATCFCVLGALVASLRFDEEALNAMVRIESSLGIQCVAKWNDTQGRTQTEVIAALEAVGL